MSSIQVFSKTTNNVRKNTLANSVRLNEDAVVVISANHDDFAGITINTLDAIIVLKSTEKIILQNFFHPDSDHSLVFQDDKNQLMWIQFTHPLNAILPQESYNAIDTYDAYRLVRQLSLKGSIVKFQSVLF